MILILCDKCGKLFLTASKLSVTEKGQKDFFATDLCANCREGKIDLEELRKSKEETMEIFKEGLEGRISIRNIVRHLKEEKPRSLDPELEKGVSKDGED